MYLDIGNLLLSVISTRPCSLSFGVQICSVLNGEFYHRPLSA
uniref:Uncharacterized protein n=1 Tax=Anguilla anguilla TaxID=7936 RepID=A0A0E9WLW9_ANGAN